jgi:hypothetical protein
MNTQMKDIKRTVVIFAMLLVTAHIQAQNSFTGINCDFMTMIARYLQDGYDVSINDDSITATCEKKYMAMDVICTFPDWDSLKGIALFRYFKTLEDAKLYYDYWYKSYLPGTTTDYDNNMKCTEFWNKKKVKDGVAVFLEDIKKAEYSNDFKYHNYYEVITYIKPD